MIFLANISDFEGKSVYELLINNVKLLLINHNNQFYLIENKCGHFGVLLTDADIMDEEITCSNHGISFSLLTGEVVNRPYENCDKIRIFNVVLQDKALYSKDDIN